MRWTGLPVAAILFVLCGCAGRGPVISGALGDGREHAIWELTETPFHPQARYQCGPAALASVLQQADVAVSPHDLVPQVYAPERKGSLQTEIIAAVRRYERIPYRIEPTLSALLAGLSAGRPVLILQNLGLRSVPRWHYAVMIGYSAKADQVLLRSGRSERLAMSGWRFEKSWERAERWGLVVLHPGEFPVNPNRARYLNSLAAMERTASPGVLLASYRAALNRWPEDFVARFGEASALHALGRLDQAESRYRQLLACSPQHPAVLNNLAEVLLRKGCRKEALRMIGEAGQGVSDTHPLRATIEQTRAEIMTAEGHARSQHSDATCRP